MNLKNEIEKTMTTIVRFAPSPTGRVHVGNIRTALMNYMFAKAAGGKFLLRLDDTDTERSTEEFAQGIVEDLAWLGLNHDMTAKQSDRFAEYDKATADLKARGLLYPCYETPEELDKKRSRQRLRGMPPVYDRGALELTQEQIAAFDAEGRKPHWRFKLSGEPADWNDMIRGPVTIETASVSDPVLIRADGSYLYTLPSVVDDIEFGITHIIRGEDHVTNSGTQIELFKALGGTPPKFGHHPLLVGADGSGLSKRLGSLSVQSLREGGLEPMALNSLLAKIGTSDPVEPRPTLEALIAELDLSKISRSPARFDEEELAGLNARLLHQMDFAEASQKLQAASIDIDETIWMIIRENLQNISDAKEWVEVIRGEVAPVIEDADFAAKALALLPDGDFSEETWKIWTDAIKAETGAKGKSLFMPLRLALTAKKHGPSMQNLILLIGPEKVRARLSGKTA